MHLCIRGVNKRLGLMYLYEREAKRQAADPYSDLCPPSSARCCLLPAHVAPPHLRSPAVARVQYCCVVLLRALVKADVFRLVVPKL